MALHAPRESAPLAVAGLLAVNAVPLVGVLWFGWSLYTLLIVYWLESGVVGALNVPKILLAARPAEDFSLAVNGRPVAFAPAEEAREGPHLNATNLAVAGFFVLHYGIFWVVHGVFVLAFPLFAPGAVGVAGDLSLVTVLLGVVGIVASHTVSFVTNFIGREEYRGVSADTQMFDPYRRVVVLHLTVLFGAFGVAFLGSSLVPLLLLVGLKTAGDLLAHLAEHRRASTRRDEATREGGTAG